MHERGKRARRGTTLGTMQVLRILAHVTVYGYADIGIGYLVTDWYDWSDVVKTAGIDMQTDNSILVAF